MESLMDFSKFDMSKLQDKKFMANLEKSFNNDVDKCFNEKTTCEWKSKIYTKNLEKHLQSKKHLKYMDHKDLTTDDNCFTS